MVLSEETRNLIIQDFKNIFREKYGEDWPSKLSANLRPCPNAQIANLRGVTLSDVRKVRSDLLKIGMFLNVFQSSLQAAEQELHSTQ